MKADAIGQLQRLRHLRERRAASVLAAQQRRHAAAVAALERAREEAEAADTVVQDKAAELQQLLCAGVLPVATCQAALEALDEFEGYRRLLAAKLVEAEARVRVEDERRCDLQQQLRNRQRQCEALEPLLRQRQDSDRRAVEAMEESLCEDIRPGRQGGLK